MFSIQPSQTQSTSTTSESSIGPRLIGRVTLEVALVVELVVDVAVVGEGEQAHVAAKVAASNSQARASWDDISLAAARALRTELLERGDPLVAGLTITRMAASEAPELLVSQLPGGGV
jgi:hypothetical protein